MNNRIRPRAGRLACLGRNRTAADPGDLRSGEHLLSVLANTAGRGCLLVLTSTGWDTLRDAAPSHVASVRRHFVDRLAPDELAALGRIAQKLSADRDGL
ncbi:hypothetical protein ACIQMO_09355 [Streptomyces sp. NPDC091406]|uniref:hypothetical protein n=1 Tax=Streptomyces sp. NPDC091406 TaxID=3366001 RepID=UPI00382595C0